MQKLDLTTYEFPTNGNVTPELLEEAKQRGFTGYERSKYSTMFSNLFFKGGRIKYKNMPQEKINHVMKYYRQLAPSFAPKHEHKTAVCSMLLSEVAESAEYDEED